MIPLWKQGSDPGWSLRWGTVAQCCILCSSVSNCFSWTVVDVTITVPVTGSWKSTRPHIRRRLLPFVYSALECLFGQIFLSLFVWFHGPARREDRLFVWACTHTHAHLSSPLVKHNPWNAEECHFWTGAQSYYKQVSSALCTLNITHGLHFHIKENTGAHTHTHTNTLIFSPLLCSNSFLSNASL